MEKRLLNLIKSIIILGVIIFLPNCEKPFGANSKYSIKLINDSGFDIPLYESYSHPDTLLPFNEPLIKILRSGSYLWIDSNSKWDDVLKNDTLMIFIFDRDTLNRYNWDTIRNEYKIENRLEFSLDEIYKSNSIISITLDK